MGWHHLPNTCCYSLSSSEFLPNLLKGVGDLVKVLRGAAVIRVIATLTGASSGEAGIM